jgi:acyl-coenzyme A synthetase/AMP-(fatty) acid ligase
MSNPGAEMFWAHKTEPFSEQVMLLDSLGEAWSYRAFSERVDEFITQLEMLLPQRKALCALIVRNMPATIVAYLACLRAGHALILLHAGLPEDTLREICSRFRVNLLLSTSTENEHLPACECLTTEAIELHPDLALLMSTSGSSGSPKLVRLSYRNLQANAEAIADYLSITSSDRAITLLPLHYSYGLSVLNSHLVAGASCVVYEGSVVERRFWDTFSHLQVTGLAGVPYTYEQLSRLRFEPKRYPHLRYMTQAGGKIPAQLAEKFARKLNEAGKQFYLMYGQTEATARMSYLPPSSATSHPESIGIPIPGGSFHLLDEQGSLLNDSHQPGELIYRGENVMMGYAQGYKDLAVGNTLSSLATGDLAWRDEQGLYYLKGRKDRVQKVLGIRIDLDDLQARMQAQFGELACLATDTRLQIFLENSAISDALQHFVDTQLELPASCIHMQCIERLPRTVNGKLDYPALAIRLEP